MSLTLRISKLSVHPYTGCKFSPMNTKSLFIRLFPPPRSKIDSICKRRECLFRSVSETVLFIFITGSNTDVMFGEAGHKREVLHTHTSTHAHRVTVIAERRFFRMSPLSAGQARIRVINTSLGIRSQNSLELFPFCSHGNTRGSTQ
jgi:hypothetical protein